MRILSNGPIDISYSNAKGLSADTISTIGQTAGQIGAAVAARPGRQLSEVEQKCGKRPAIRGKKRNEWDKCAREFASASAQPVATSTQNAPAPQKKVPTWAWVVGGIVGVSLIGFVIYKSVKK